MKFGIPAETPAGETRVAATPEMVNKLAASGHHTVLVQSSAGTGIPIEFESGLQGFRGRLGFVDFQRPVLIEKGNSCLRS